jgi:CubicO group peptidase (beta-lactamase class C family)
MATGYDHSEDGVFQAARYVDSSLAFGGGDIYSTVDDLFRFDQALYSEILLSRELIESMQQPKVTTPSGNGYGYGWDVVHTPIQFIGHLGDASGFISVIIRVPEKGRTIILLSNQSDTNLRKIGTEIYRILDQQLLDKVLE